MRGEEEEAMGEKEERDVLLTLQQLCSHMIHESPLVSEMRDLNTRRQHHQRDMEQ